MHQLGLQELKCISSHPVVLRFICRDRVERRPEWLQPCALPVGLPGRAYHTPSGSYEIFVLSLSSKSLLYIFCANSALNDSSTLDIQQNSRYGQMRQEHFLIYISCASQQPSRPPSRPSFFSSPWTGSPRTGPYLPPQPAPMTTVRD